MQENKLQIKNKLPRKYKVTSHTDFVGMGSTFVAIPGLKADGLSFVPLALKKGATQIVVQSDVDVDDFLKKLIEKFDAELIFVDNARLELALLSAQSLNHPAKKLKIIGITGTKGKTSIAYMLYHLLMGLGKRVAVSSTVEKLILKEKVKINLTTPLPDQLHLFFDLCVQSDIEYVLLEVSAQALSLHRIDGIEFETGVFTNLSMEHLEFYKDLKEYFEAKVLFIDKIKDKKNMFVNIDEKYGKILVERYPTLSTFSLEDKRADFYGYPRFLKNGMELFFKSENKKFKLKFPLLGRFNASNVLSVLAVLKSIGINLEELNDSLTHLIKIPGRMERYRLKNGAICFLDYAHNPSSFEAVLSTLRMMTSHLIIVFGAGGCRYKEKRPIMGEIAQKYGNEIVLTSDNPRSEKPEAIMDDISTGFVSNDSCKIYKEVDRTKAIEFAYSVSKKESIIAILGKGPDEFQIVGNMTFPLKERSIIKKFRR